MALNKRMYVDRDTDIPITAENLNDIQDEIIGTTSYAVCSTAATTAAKTADITNFVLAEGRTVKIKFANANTAANPTLNVNGTGAKPIMQYGTTRAGTDVFTSWSAGAVVTLVYDGTNWVMSEKAPIGNVGGLTYTVVSTW